MMNKEICYVRQVRREVQPVECKINSKLMLKPFQITVTGFKETPEYDPYSGKLVPRVAIQAFVCDANDGSSRKIEFKSEMPPYDMTPEQRQRYIFMALMEMLEHEAQECFRHSNGSHVFEPHPDEVVSQSFGSTVHDRQPR